MVFHDKALCVMIFVILTVYTYEELFLGNEAQILLFGAKSPFATSKADFQSCKDLMRVRSGLLQYFH